MKTFSLLTIAIGLVLALVHFGQKLTSGFTFVPTAADAAVILLLAVWAAIMYLAESRR